MRRTINYRLEKHKETEPEAVQALQDLYVDDLPTGAASEEKAFEIYESTKRVMKCGGFNLRKWKSNSKALSDRIGKYETINASKPEDLPEKASAIEDDRTYVETVVGPQAVDESKTKILGLSWDTKEDELFFEFSEIRSYAKQLPQTKRSSRVKGTNEQVIVHGLNLSAAEILRAENMWIRSVQESSFAEELKYL
ncbi:Hypothetical predicted protein [Paramuricea clavata]|uniref:Uncharacterized protein n=1 Tax=Paramuricea clavata TaxID=317549 RepID=A0A6S7FT17_PARCT|nr:Hypothetical predicted protein [Paramuricea clavata]